MTKTKNDFTYSEYPEPHKERTKAILKSHPEVRSLISRNPKSFIITVFTVSLQIAIAVLLKEQPWWLILLAAACRQEQVRI